MSFRLPYGATLELVRCPAGSFVMGSPLSEKERYADERQHRVMLTKPFWIGRYETTQKQYQAVMGNNPSLFKGDDHPVENVSWFDAMTYCARLNYLTESERPVGYEFALPTEAQWEYACRAGSSSAYAGDLDKMGWYGESESCGHTHPVGLKAPNRWGIYDMHGNVCEWCCDGRVDYLNDETDPVKAKQSVFSIRRGGSWNIRASHCRCAYRHNFGARGHRSKTMGFRVALVPILLLKANDSVDEVSINAEDK